MASAKLKTEEVTEEVSQPTSVLFECPPGEHFTGYHQTTLSVKSLTSEQAYALQRLTAALRNGHLRCQKNTARTDMGVVVDTPADAVRWILDQLYIQYDEVAK